MWKGPQCFGSVCKLGSALPQDPPRSLRQNNKHDASSVALEGLYFPPRQCCCLLAWTVVSAAGTATRSSMATNPDDIWNDNENDRWTALDDSVEGAWEGAVDWRAEEEWNSTYTLRLPLVPISFVPHGWDHGLSCLKAVSPSACYVLLLLLVLLLFCFCPSCLVSLLSFGQLDRYRPKPGGHPKTSVRPP